MADKKPIIIAICGKSATGKDTLAAWLSNILKAIHIPSNFIISDTTRPRRVYEQDDVDYNFLTKTDFLIKLNKEEYLEYSFFNGWLYGTSFTSINPNSVNIGVFNPDGICRLAAYQNKYEILCVYLTCNIYQRIKRSIKREGCFKIEYIRRALSDNNDFKHFDNILNRFPNYFIFNSNKMSLSQMADHIIRRIKMKNLLPVV